MVIKRVTIKRMTVRWMKTTWMKTKRMKTKWMKMRYQKKDKTIISHLWGGARIYAKKLFDTTYANKIEKRSGYNAYYTSFLNALDKQEESIRLKLSSLLKEISKVDIEYRESMYKL